VQLQLNGDVIDVESPKLYRKSRNLVQPFFSTYLMQRPTLITTSQNGALLGRPPPPFPLPLLPPPRSPTTNETAAHSGQPLQPSLIFIGMNNSSDRQNRTEQSRAEQSRAERQTDRSLLIYRFVGILVGKIALDSRSARFNVVSHDRHHSPDVFSLLLPHTVKLFKIHQFDNTLVFSSFFKLWNYRIT